MMRRQAWGETGPGLEGLQASRSTIDVATGEGRGAAIARSTTHEGRASASGTHDREDHL